MSRAQELIEQDKYLRAAEEEMRRGGLYDEDASYGSGAIAKCVLELLDTWHKQGHSGGSASMTLFIFDKLVNHKVLSPLTTESGEWMDVSEYQGGKPLWQNRRQSSCFSLDSGKTYYDVNESRPRWKIWLARVGVGYHGFTFHQSKDLLA